MRNPVAQAANHRNAGPMRHRLAPRGGANTRSLEDDMYDSDDYWSKYDDVRERYYAEMEPDYDEDVVPEPGLETLGANFAAIAIHERNARQDERAESQRQRDREAIEAGDILF